MTPTRVRRATLKELDASEETLQTGFWGAFKERFGWSAHPFVVDYKDFSLGLLVLSRGLAPGARLAYVPFGPGGAEPELGREEMVTALGFSLQSHLPWDTVFVRFDLPWHRAGLGHHPEPLAASRWLRKSSVDIQPPSTVILDIHAEEKEILATMKQKWRYNIGLARRKGVVVTEGDGDRLADWYRIHQQTGERDRITIHSLAYYRGLFELGRTYGPGAPSYRLLLAEVDDEVVAGIIVAFRGRRAWYPYGASSDRHRNLMPNYALQWRGIQLARKAGCTTYDLFGIPPAEDPDHPMHGLFRFKTGFGGTVINRYGCYDVVLRRGRYAAYRRAEELRDHYYKRIRKRR